MANAKYYGKLMSTSDAASYLGVSSQAVSSYIRKGLLTATDLSTGTSRPIYGIREEDIIDFTMRQSKIKKSSKDSFKKHSVKTKEIKRCAIKERPNKYKDEICELKKKVKQLNEELLDICLRLEELTN